MSKAINWDLWRRRHETMSFADQQQFYRAVLELHPKQRQFNPCTCWEALDRIDERDLDVVEIGGWDGVLATMMMGHGFGDSIATWTNYDIVCPPQFCGDPRYEFVLLDDYLWNRETVKADLFVATHVLEHLTREEVAALLGVLDTRWLYVESPLPQSETANAWLGYEGSHILEIGWEQLETMFEDFGFSWSGVRNLWQR